MDAGKRLLHTLLKALRGVETQAIAILIGLHWLIVTLELT